MQAGVQVVSGAAQGFEGQLIVLNKILDDEFASSVAAEAKKRKERGPCYRCLFPKAPRPEDVTDCAEGGVLGGVTGLVGTMQALEAVKLLTGVGEGENFEYSPLEHSLTRHIARSNTSKHDARLSPLLSALSQRQVAPAQGSFMSRVRRCGARRRREHDSRARVGRLRVVLRTGSRDEAG